MLNLNELIKNINMEDVNLQVNKDGDLEIVLKISKEKLLNNNKSDMVSKQYKELSVNPEIQIPNENNYMAHLFAKYAKEIFNSKLPVEKKQHVEEKFNSNSVPISGIEKNNFKLKGKPVDKQNNNNVLCNHRYKNGKIALNSYHDDVKCSICGEVFKLFEGGSIAKDNINDVLQTTLVMDLDILSNEDIYFIKLINDKTFESISKQELEMINIIFKRIYYNFYIYEKC